MLVGLWPDIRSFCNRPVVAVPGALSGDALAVDPAACGKPELCLSSQFSSVDGVSSNPGKHFGVTLRT